MVEGVIAARRLDGGLGSSPELVEDARNRAAWFLFPDSHFPLAFPPIWR
jgi:hypothetical protein